MEFDIKNNLNNQMKTTVGDNRLGQKNIKAAIDESLVTSMAQKNLDMDLDKNNAKKAAKEKEEKDKNKKKLIGANSQEMNEAQKKEQQNIVKDPLKLLKLL